MQFVVAAASAGRQNVLCYNRPPFNQRSSLSVVFLFQVYAALARFSRREAQLENQEAQ